MADYDNAIERVNAMLYQTCGLNEKDAEIVLLACMQDNKKRIEKRK